MECTRVLLDLIHEPLPRIASEHGTRLDRFGDKLCTLGEDPTTADSIVTDFTVSHVIVRWEPHRSSVRFKLCPWHGVIQRRERACLCFCNCISLWICSKANSVHDCEDYWSLSLYSVVFLQWFHHMIVLLGCGSLANLR